MQSPRSFSDGRTASRSGADEEVILVDGADERLIGNTPVVSRRERRCWRLFIALSVVSAVFVLVMVTVMWHRAFPAARNTATGEIIPHTFPFFVLCFVAGAIAGLAHVAVTPLDLVKCRVQVGEYASTQEGFQSIMREARGSSCRAVQLLFHGWVPTFFAYVTQGALKFSLYELGKYALEAAWLSSGSGPSARGVSASTRLTMYLFASAVAELVADIGLAPFEAVKVRMQTSRTCPSALSVMLPRMWLTEGLHGFYKGLVPLWCRQVPYTMMKFASFESIVRLLTAVFLPRTSGPPSAFAQLVVTMVAGVLAGFLCALISHPADTLVSKMNQRGRRGTPEGTHTPTTAAAATVGGGVHGAEAAHHVSVETGGKGTFAAMNYRKSSEPGAAQSSSHLTVLDDPAGAAAAAVDVAPTAAAPAGDSMWALIVELGWFGLWKGLVTRMLMVGFLTSLQWLLYDAFKVAAGLPTTGGGSAGANDDVVK